MMQPVVYIIYRSNFYERSRKRPRVRSIRLQEPQKPKKHTRHMMQNKLHHIVNWISRLTCSNPCLANAQCRYHAPFYSTPGIKLTQSNTLFYHEQLHHDKLEIFFELFISILYGCARITAKVVGFLLQNSGKLIVMLTSPLRRECMKWAEIVTMIMVAYKS